LLLILEMIAFVGLAFYDAQFTKVKLRQFGVQAELNPLVRFLAKKLGNVGVDIGVSLPTVGIILLGRSYPELLTYLLGWRTCLFAFQLHARGLQKALDNGNETDNTKS
jgi:hypothetical protein